MPNGYLSPDNPADDAFPITPNDGADLAVPVRKLVIATAGTLHVVTIAGVERTFTAVPVGVFPVGVRKVFAAGTSATGITGII
jgi:hypothetical protein